MVVVSADVSLNVKRRPTLEVIARAAEMDRERAHELYEMFYAHGPGNGTMLTLPFDQLVEHGIGHMFKWERAADPRAVIELAAKGPFSAIALPIGLAEKYRALVREAGKPLIVKVDGHFLVGDEVNYPRHSTMAGVERAVEAGANAIGLTYYFGSEAMQEDTERVERIIERAHNLHKPIIMWAYARGPLAARMGEDSLYWCAQAVCAGEQMGADVVKQKFPAPAKNQEEYRKQLQEKGYFQKKMPEVDRMLELEPNTGEELTMEMQIKRLNLLAEVAPHTLKVISGGPKYKDPQKDLVETTRIVMDSGNEGRIVGRNLWGSHIEEALRLAGVIAEIMGEEKYARRIAVGGQGCAAFF